MPGRRWAAHRRWSSAGARAVPPGLYFVFDAAPVEEALAQLRIGLLAAGAAAIGVALLVAGIIARWLLRPVTAAGSAARRIAAGDLGARVPRGGSDEVGRWASEFNRMADSLQGLVARLEASQGQNRRFVADVAHELRTPAHRARGGGVAARGGPRLPAARRRGGPASCSWPTSAGCGRSSMT